MSKRRRKRKKKPDSAERTGAGGKAPKERKPEDKPEEKKQGKKKKSPARNLIETVVVVAALVLVLRGFLLEAFKIPSSSMEPTLLGHPYHGDRVLAFKPSVTLGTPGRWSVVVFLKRPDRLEKSKGETTNRNFIKRVVGIPGDRLMLAGGDVFVEGAGPDDYAIARKPPSVQEEVWHPVYDSRHDRLSAGAQAGARRGTLPWKLDEGLAHDAANGTISGGSDGTAWARFAANHHEDDKGLVTNLYVKRLRIGVVCPLPGCGREFKADIGTTRTRVPCPGCGEVVDVLADPPAADPTEQEAPERTGRTRFLVWVGCTDCPDAFEAALPGLRRQVPCPRCGKAITPACYPVRREGEVPVADLRVSFDVRSSSDRGWVLAEVSVDDESYTARVPLGGGAASVSVPPRRQGSQDLQGRPSLAYSDVLGVLAVPPGAARRVSFAKVDQALVLLVDGREIIRKEYSVGWKERAGRPTSNSVRIGIEGARAAFERVLIERDLHYLPRGNPELFESYSAARGRWTPEPRAGEGDAIRMRERLGASQFVMLGDNSPSSYDGRMWPPVDKGDMVGRAFFLFWPPSRMRRVR